VKAKPKSEAKQTSKENISVEGLQDLFQPPRLSKPELHLLLKPFFVLDRHADRSRPIEYVYSSMQNGRAVTRSWGVQPHYKYGLPGPFDRDVTLVIYELVNENYFAKNLSVPLIMPIGSMRDFAQRMGITPCGKNISAIKESLNRLRNTFVDCEETFFDKRKKAYVSVSFRLLAGVGFLGENDGDGRTSEDNFVLFDQVILENLNCGYVSVIDLGAVQRLKTNIAKQLYAHLAYRFFVEKQDGDFSWTADYQWLAIHLGIKPQTELRFAKHQLKDAHEELKQFGYISSYSWDGWRVTYCPGHVWKGEQMRRESGKSKHRQSEKQLLLDFTLVAREPQDPMLPALAAFASGLTVGQDRIKAMGLTSEQATALCVKKNIQLNPLLTKCVL
jgi:hypothetical protein